MKNFELIKRATIRIYLIFAFVLMSKKFKQKKFDHFDSILRKVWDFPRKKEFLLQKKPGKLQFEVNLSI